MGLRTWLLAASALAMAAGPAALAAGPGLTQGAAASAEASAAKAAIGAWGFDLAGRDLNVKPGDDFFRYSGGVWMKENQIPQDRSRWGVFDMLAEQSRDNTRAIIEEMAQKRGAAGTLEQKIGDYYNAYLDVDTINAKGLAPARADLRAIARARTHEDVARLMSRPDLPLSSPIAAFPSLDQKNPDRYILYVSQSGLGLPDRDFYLKDDERSVEIRKAYVAHIAKMLELAGQRNPQAQADAIMALETEIAKIHWDRTKNRERELTYNLRSKDELLALAPEYPWQLSFETAGLQNQTEFVVRQLDAIPQLAKLFRATPVATWRSYMTWAYLRNYASVLPKAFDDENFAFYGTILNGQPQQRERWKRAVDAVGGSLGEAVGKIYVERHFPPEAKAQMLELVENIRKAYAQRIDALTWMTPETKVVAREKLASFQVKIGYPDVWEDYANLEVKAGDAFGNMRRTRVYEWGETLERLNKPTDRREWFMTPQTVNAYYNPTFNEIVFPAAILQPPFFDPKADPAVNYGGIGGVIGHEMGHGFDDQGAKSDPRGVLRTWWNERDVAAFGKLGDRLAAQYSQYEPLPGLRLNGRLGLGENIGDNGGLQVSYEAYRMSLGGKDAPVIDGYTGDQRFFHGWGQVWRALYREQALRNQVIVGPHSPPEFRVNGTVRNMDSWYSAFNVQPGDKLYLPPEERVKIW